MGRCAAVLFVDKEIHYSEGRPADQIVNMFAERCDNQITTLEILAVSVGMSTFCEELTGRRVIIYSDNTGAEATLLW